MKKLSEEAGKVHIARARYDAAQTTDENRKTFSAADGYSADAANNLGVRMILRNRARYVFANNPRAKGIIRTAAKHTIGTGPRLQMMLGDGKNARTLNERIESLWRSWAAEVKLAKKLRVCRIAKIISGEVFPKLVLNPGMDHPVKLDLQLIEADQVCNPTPAFQTEDVDGIFFDQFGNRSHYRILKVHPGEALRIGLNPMDYDDVPAQFVLHYFDEERPNQHRGIPEITPAVQLFEEGRRFRAAVLAAAETAADFAVVIHSDSAADPNPTQAGSEDTETQFSPMDTVELRRRMATVLPQGWNISQTKAEQPTTTFKEFSRELLAEVARCLEMPLSLASLDASDANMSSSYVVNQPYENAINVERGDLETEILNPILDAWLTLAFDPAGEARLSRRVPGEFPRDWYWPLVMEHADPQKRANAQVARLEANTTTLMREFAREGLDWETELRQRAKEKKLAKELGLVEEETLPNGKPKPTQKEDEDE